MGQLILRMFLKRCFPGEQGVPTKVFKKNNAFRRHFSLRMWIAKLFPYVHRARVSGNLLRSLTAVLQTVASLVVTSVFDILQFRLGCMTFVVFAVRAGRTGFCTHRAPFFLRRQQFHLVDGRT